MGSIRIMVIMIMIEKGLLSNVQWKIKQHMIEFGKPLLLDCEIPNNFQPNKSRQWTRGEDNQLLCFDNVAINRDKYNGRINSPTEYLLTILNITEDDLVYVYSCRVGFAFRQKQIEVNDSNLLHKPETTDIKYEMLNGNYSLRLNFSQVFPKPLCRVKLNGKYKNLTIAHEKQPRVLYRVIYELESKEALHGCGKTVEIECDIGRQKFNISEKHDLDCKNSKSNTSAWYFLGSAAASTICLVCGYVSLRGATNDQSMIFSLEDTNSTIPYLAIKVSVPIVVIVILVIMVYFIYTKLRKSRRNNDGNQYIQANKESHADENANRVQQAA